MELDSLPISVATACILAALLTTGCDTPGQGAKYGAIIGAAAGGLHTGSIKGAAAGAAVGAGTGALTGKIRQDRRRERYRDSYPEDRYYNEPEPDFRDPDINRGRYPIGRRTDRSGFVRSPYPPNYLIDVRGIPRGAKVVDPSCNRVFINP